VSSLESWFAQVPLLLLIAVRIGALLFVAPCFASRLIPPALRVWLSLMVAVLLLPVAGAGVTVPSDPLGLALLAAREAAMGVLIGLAVQVVISAAQYGGRLAGAQIGFGFAASVDPSFGEQEVILDRLHDLLAVTLFVTTGAHRVVLAGLARSYTIVPVGHAQFSGRIAEAFLALFGNSVVIAVQIAAPVVASVILAELAMALLSRSVPQFNLFSVGFGVRIVVGIVVAALALPATLALIQRTLIAVPNTVDGLVAALAH